jgi:DNA polymerase/3'-5' exonuclease PolX
MPLKQAQDIAVAVCYKLQPYCEKINIAGSVRRHKPEVKDIEIICQPKIIEEIVQVDMFKADFKKSIHPYFIREVNNLGNIVKGFAIGKYLQIELPDKSFFMLDLFIPDDFDYYRQYAIRTGSAEYAANVIATGWRKIGWCGSDKGLRKMSDCIRTQTADGKTKWKCLRADADLPPVWQSEEEFFDWIKVKVIHPSKRI